uniref:Transmembrane protein n=1 Tax=Pithovirus LCPAC304 TaxID=2506594 RepID=A0A481Z8L0_9VIRU|nr:MAG: hypothetical protein LCPAC304_00480 [Pithovirus LCPAC304]
MFLKMNVPYIHTYNKTMYLALIKKTKITLIGLWVFSIGVLVYNGLTLRYGYMYVVPFCAGYWVLLSIGWVGSMSQQRLLLFYVITQALVALFSLMIYLIVVFTFIGYTSTHEITHYHVDVQLLVIQAMIEVVLGILTWFSCICGAKLYLGRKQSMDLQNKGVYVVNSYTNTVTNPFKPFSLYPDAEALNSV